MADTIQDVTNQFNTDIRNKTTNRSVTRDNVSDAVQILADNQRADWNETDPNALTFIQNKPQSASVLLKGEVDLGDLGNTISFRGGITGASRVQGDQANAIIEVQFSNLGTSNYVPYLQLYGITNTNNSCSGVGQVGYLKPTLTSTSFRFSIREFAGETQDCGVYIKIEESF